MILKRLIELKEDHASSIAEGNEQIKGQNEMLRDIQNKTDFLWKQIQKRGKEK
jgi:hypothetical protein